MRETLYLSLEKFSLRYVYCMYLDVKPYLADQLFVRHKVRVRFNGEYVKNGFPYALIVCHIRKKDMAAFNEALKDLKRNMIICGYTDYEAEASALLDDMERFKEEKRHGKNDTAGKAVQSQPT